MRHARRNNHRASSERAPESISYLCGAGVSGNGALPHEVTEMPNVITEVEYARMVAADNGEPITTSLKVAEYFNKRHADVLRAIQCIDCSHDFSQRNFALAEYRDRQGKPRSMYSMTKDGFIFLVMGFTGKKAAYIKEAYINAFNWMAARLNTFERRRNEVVALFKAEQHTGSVCGRGLNRWKYVRRDLEDEMDKIEVEGQLAIPFCDLRREASNDDEAYSVVFERQR